MTPAVGHSPRSDPPDPENRNRSVSNTLCSHRAPPAGSSWLSYIDAEVPGGAQQRPARCQCFGDVFQGDGSWDDPHGETDHQEAFGASEGPAVSWMDVWLQITQTHTAHLAEKQQVSFNFNTLQTVTSSVRKQHIERVCSYLDHSSGRLREIPERNSKQAEQSRLRLKSL